MLSGHIVMPVCWDSQWEDPKRAPLGNVWTPRVAFGIATVWVDSVASESSSITCVIADNCLGTQVCAFSRRYWQLLSMPCDSGVLFRLLNRQGVVTAKMNVVLSLMDARSPLCLRRTQLVQFMEVLSAWYLRNRQQERGGQLNDQI